MTERLLALDTATETVHLALVVGEATHVRALAGGAQASVTLMPAIQALLVEAGCPANTLDAIAFGRGPGAFTGLRTACAVAQGLALGLDRPVIALDTLMAVAEHATAQAAGTPTVWAMNDARMGQVYAAAYRRDPEGAWHGLEAPAVWDPTALADRLRGDASCTLAGNALAAYAAAWEGLTHVRDAQAAPQGTALATLARAAWARGDTLDPALALPLYVRDKIAFTTAERQAQAAARAA